MGGERRRWSEFASPLNRAGGSEFGGADSLPLLNREGGAKVLERIHSNPLLFVRWIRSLPLNSAGGRIRSSEFAPLLSRDGRGANSLQRVEFAGGDSLQRIILNSLSEWQGAERISPSEFAFAQRFC